MPPTLSLPEISALLVLLMIVTFPVRVPPRIPPTPLEVEITISLFVHPSIVGVAFVALAPAIPPTYLPVEDIFPLFIQVFKVAVPEITPAIPPE